MKRETEIKVIDTTLGDLVFAIHEAAEEASIDEKDLGEFTREMVMRLLGDQFIFDLTEAELA